MQIGIVHSGLTTEVLIGTVLWAQSRLELGHHSHHSHHNHSASHKRDHVASNLVAMASNLIGMASNLLVWKR